MSLDQIVPSLSWFSQFHIGIVLSLPLDLLIILSCHVSFNCVFPMQEDWTTVLLRVMFCLSSHSMCMSKVHVAISLPWI